MQNQSLSNKNGPKIPVKSAVFLYISFFKFDSTHLYTWVEKGTVRVKYCILPKNTTKCPQPRLVPRALDLETSALTIEPHSVWGRSTQG